MASKLHRTAKRFGLYHAKESKAKQEKENARKELLEQIADEISQRKLARKTLEIKRPLEESDLDEYISKYFFGWRAIEKEQVHFGNRWNPGWKVILEEDPKYIGFSLVNPEDGQVYQKVVADGQLQIDEELLKQEKRKLYYQVTHIPKPKRELKPLDELTHEQIAAISSYFYTTPKTVKVLAPRKAKEEELEDLNE